MSRRNKGLQGIETTLRGLNFRLMCSGTQCKSNTLGNAISYEKDIYLLTLSYLPEGQKPVETLSGDRGTGGRQCQCSSASLPALVQAGTIFALSPALLVSAQAAAIFAFSCQPGSASGRLLTPRGHSHSCCQIWQQVQPHRTWLWWLGGYVSGYHESEVIRETVQETTKFIETNIESQAK